MKRSTKVEIALVAGLAMSGCGRRAYDPCAPQTFNELACQEAVNHNGYYSGGHWYPHTYYGGYSSYYNSYHSYIGGGGRITQVSPSQWSRPGGTATGASGTAAGTSSGGSVSRGVFGSTGHGGGGGQ